MKKLILMILGFSTAAIGAQTTESTSVYRMQKKMGAYLSLLGDPSPTIAGVNASYNILPYLRAHGGFGQVKMTTGISANGSSMETKETTVTTIGAGAHLMVPTWNFTPVAGLGYSHVFVTGNAVSTNIGADNIYYKLGFDWQGESGFNIGFGINSAITVAKFSIPYLNFGYYF